KEDMKQEQITFNLLPDEFTMPELHQLHQTILEENLDRSRFQKRCFPQIYLKDYLSNAKILPGEIHITTESLLKTINSFICQSFLAIKR
ncbi:MAG: hypothetical protein WBN50_13505, partial [Lutimonas sp.]